MASFLIQTIKVIFEFKRINQKLSLPYSLTAGASADGNTGAAPTRVLLPARLQHCRSLSPPCQSNQPLPPSARALAPAIEALLLQRLMPRTHPGYAVAGGRSQVLP
jgi:hypothetical protein